jgi:hypothetical protein
MRTLIVFVSMTVVLQATPALADLVVNSTGSTTLIDFESTLVGVNNGRFTGVGFTQGAMSVGQLDSDTWAVFGLSDGPLNFGSNDTTGDAARGIDHNGASTGGIYSFDTDNDATVGNNAALGFQVGENDMTPGNIQLLTTNQTTETIGSVEVSYDILALNDQDRANSLNFRYSTDGITFTQITALDFTSGEVRDDLDWVSTSRTATIGGLSLSVGDSFYLQWLTDDVSGGGSRDEFAIDNIGISFTAVPEPGAVAMMCLLGLPLISCRRRRESGSQS